MAILRRKGYYEGPISDHFDGTRFFNTALDHTNSLWDLIYWKLTSKRKPWPKKKAEHVLDIPPIRVEGKQLRVSFVGHSTVLIQTEGLNILTDPIWSKCASPFKHFGPSRHVDPGILLENLPHIDIILISHNHYDHLDIRTIREIYLKSNPLIITPLGNDVIIKREIPAIKIVALDWHQSYRINENVKIHLVPSLHWSSRNMIDKNQALWGSFVIEAKNEHLYFAGDTGYGDGEIFRSILKKFKSFRFAMLPIGAYAPRWFMKSFHMCPEEAALCCKDLGEPYTLAIHHKTFRLADEGFDDPTKVLIASCEQLGISQERFRTLEAGKTWIIPES